MKWMKAVFAGAALALAVPGVTMAEDELLNGLKIGVLVFDPDDAQTKTFRNYLENYLGEAFDASFYYSEACNTAEEEAAFIEKLHEMGIKGVIGNLKGDALALCEKYGIYYVYGAATVSDEEFEELKDQKHFLGTVSASLEEEETTGRKMAAFFAEDEGKEEHHFVICTGGDTELHRTRSRAMIQELAETYGLELPESAEKLAAVEEITEIETGSDRKITLIPGFPGATPLDENVKKVLETGGYDTLMSVMSVNSIMEAVSEAEANTGKDVRVGSVDCFTEEAKELFEEADAFGNSKLNYLAGKHGGMISTAFAALCNAYSGNLDVLREDGHAFRLYQDFWVASSSEEFEKLYEHSLNLYDNAYSAADIMSVIKAFNPDVTFEDFRAFAEQDTIE